MYKIVNDAIENGNNLYEIISDRGMSGEEVFNMFTDYHGMQLVTREMCENLRDCEGFDEFDDEDFDDDVFDDIDADREYTTIPASEEAVSEETEEKAE